MSRPKASPNLSAIDGSEYAWEYRHGWIGDWEKSVKRVSVSVALRPGRTRELVLDLTFHVPGMDRNPSHAKVGRAVERGIRGAMEAGWDPESRGKAFRFDVGNS